ncbi:MAG: short-chain dehydrogenase [Chitinophagaceae bacterium]|nr:short-chain dehydrogenase [Chitinophagaceae bacterium]
MNIEEIEKFLDKQALKNEEHFRIDFKKRDAVYGIIVKSRDYNDLKSKNFWRIVTKTNFTEWHKTQNINLAKIFNGSEFTRLKVV